MTKPNTVMFNKVEIKNEKQVNQMFGPAERGVGIYIHWDAQDNNKIQDWNYEATKLAIKRAVEGKPTPAEVIAQEDVMHHPLAAHD